MKALLRLMNKKKYIVLITFFVIILTTTFIVSQVFSYHKVNLTVIDNVSMLVYKTEGSITTDIATIDKSTSLSLKNGTYCAKPLSDSFDKSPICFDVENNDMSIIIDPDYSRTRLEALLSDQLAVVNAVITTKYGSIIDNYTVQDGQLYEKGQWYGTTLTEIVDRGGRGDVYRLVLNKKNNQWTVAAHPQIVLSKFDYPNIPFSVLSNVNRLIGEY